MANIIKGKKKPGEKETSPSETFDKLTEKAKALWQKMKGKKKEPKQGTPGWKRIRERLKDEEAAGIKRHGQKYIKDEEEDEE